MKRCIILAAFAMMATAISAFAQEKVFNTADFTYSPMTVKVNAGFLSMDVNLNAVSANWTQARLMTDQLPVYLQYGAGLQYAFGSLSVDASKTSMSFMTLKAPVSAMYMYTIPNTPVILMPYLGLNLQFHLLGQCKTTVPTGDYGDSEYTGATGKYSFFNKDDMEGDTFNRLVLGWQIGARVMYDKYLFGIGYDGPVTNLYKGENGKIRTGQVNISLGICF